MIKMNLGEKIRALRKKKDMTLDELSDLSGVAKATLSRIENGLAEGNIKTYIKICKVLNVNIKELFADIDQTEEEDVVLTAESEEAEVFEYDEKVSATILTRDVLKKKMMPMILIIGPGGQTHLEENPKGTEKFLFCLEGRIEARVDNKCYQLKKGNALYFKGSIPHLFKNIGKGTAKCLWVSTPVAL
jgi:transcriptional regulator with XRE-family HTH domain